jgi:hypothetical protein
VSNFNGNGLVDDGPNSGRRGPGAGLRPGQLCVENLKAIQEFHPVLLFGTQGSGKTHVLLSLLAYARYQTSMGVQTEFGCSSERDIFPADYAAASGVAPTVRFISAKKMYDDEVQTFENGLDTAGTGIRDPFFVPISLIRGSEKTKLLFVEANGEWYQRETTVFTKHSRTKLTTFYYIMIGRSQWYLWYHRGNLRHIVITRC